MLFRILSPAFDSVSYYFPTAVLFLTMFTVMGGTLGK